LAENPITERNEEVVRGSSITGFIELIDFNPHEKSEIPDEPESMCFMIFPRGRYMLDKARVLKVG